MENLRDLLKEFYPFARKRFGFDKNAKIIFLEDEDNASNPLGKTAYYNPGDYTVSVYVTGRHPKDILRSVSHELVHHTQNCRGEFTNTENMGGQGYAQKDEHLREMEREAYEQGNLCFRDWEDMRKNNLDTNYVNEDGNMSNKDLRNNRLNSHIMEKWGFSSKQEETEEQVKEENGYDDDYELSDLEADFPWMKGSASSEDAEAAEDAKKDAGGEFDDEEEDELEEGAKVYVIATENCGEEATVLEMLDDSTAKIQIGDEELVIRQDYLEKIKLDEAAKPDFLDLDKDGDKEEPMKSAAEDAKEDDDEDEDVKEEQKIQPDVEKAGEQMLKYKPFVDRLEKIDNPREAAQMIALVAKKIGISDYEQLISMSSYLKQAFAITNQDTTTNQDVKEEVEIPYASSFDTTISQFQIMNVVKQKIARALESLAGQDNDKATQVLHDALEDLESDDPQFNPVAEEETVEEISSCAGGAVEGAPMPKDDDEDEDEKLEESFSLKSAASNRNKLLSEQVMKAWFNK